MTKGVHCCLVVATVLVACVCGDAKALGSTSGRSLPKRGNAFASKSKRQAGAREYIDGYSQRRGLTEEDMDDMGLDFRSVDRPISRRERRRRRQPSVRERLEALAKSGQSVASDVFRRAKVLKSSPFEGLILRATWPDDHPVSPDLLEELIQHSIPAFKLARWMPDEDPYHMTTHKIWTKMAEKDWRTVVKATTLLHSISRDSGRDACKKFASAIKVMSRARNIKSPDHRYFDMDVISELSDEGEPFVDLVVSYATYVLTRAKTFSGRFEELTALSTDSDDNKISRVLKRVENCVTLGLQVLEAEVPRHNPISVHTMQLVGSDLRDLWSLLEEKLRPFAEDSSALSGVSESGRASTASALKFYHDNRETVEASISAVSKLCRKHRLKPPGNPGKAVPISAAVLRSRISELSGGYRCDGDVCRADDEIANRYCSSDFKGGSSLLSADEDWSDDEYDDFEDDEDDSEGPDESEDDDYSDAEESSDGEGLEPEEDDDEGSTEGDEDVDDDDEFYSDAQEEEDEYLEQDDEDEDSDEDYDDSSDY